MTPEQSAFVRYAFTCGALRLGGPFRLKSGRVSPYFFDSSRFTTGADLWVLSEEYVRTMLEAYGDRPPDLFFGPAYKGIPLAVACAMQMERLTGHRVGYLFDRKEAKLHGEHSAEAGTAAEQARKRLVGRLPEPGMRIVMLDDVLTTGGTKVEALELLALAEPGARVEALVIALDRQEAGPEGLTASQEFTKTTGIPVHAVLNASELLEAMRAENLGRPEDLERLEAYLREQGVKA
jgi:orotate phosphoribosyltransferase